MMGIWYEIRSATLGNDVFGAFLFCNAKNNTFARRYELTQPTIWKITNIAQNLKMLGTETPFKTVIAENVIFQISLILPNPES